MSGFHKGGVAHIAITADMHLELQGADISDVILLRRVGNKHSFLKLLSLINENQKISGKRTIWDFADNTKYFESYMGTMIGAELKKSAKLSAATTDKPAKQDWLGREGLVSVLKGLVDRKTKKHMVIALFGRWGSGKSSVIQLLEKQYEADKSSSFIVFNAWQAEHSNNMSASIANQIIDSLYDSRGIVSQIALSLKAHIVAGRVGLLIDAVYALVIALFVVVIPVGGGMLPKQEWLVKIGMVLGLGSGLLPLVAIARAYFKFPFTKKLRELSSRPDFNQHIGVGHTIRENLACLTKVYPIGTGPLIRGIYTGKFEVDHRYILVVDDLDRCSDKKIIETLEALQLIVDLKGMSVILAVDHKILLDAVAARYIGQRKGLTNTQALELARNYLGKILQITVTLDRPSSASRLRFIKNKLYSDMTVEPTESEDVPLESDVQISVNDNVSPEDPLDFSAYEDDYVDNFDRTDEYLQDSKEEFEFFSKCANQFKVHNPRTLIRIHNAISLVKGLYPELIGDAKLINSYIYMAFWYEVYSSKTESTREEMKSQLFAGNKSEILVDPGLEDAVSFANMTPVELRRTLYRVKNMSLPSALEV